MKKNNHSIPKQNQVNLQRQTDSLPRAYLEFEDGAALEDAATNTRDQLLISILRHAGCRISEALGLTVDNIDFSDKTICIKHLKATIHLSCPNCEVRLSRTATFCPRCGKPVAEALSVQKEQTKMRTIPLDQNTMDLLKYFIDNGGPVIREGKKFIFGINRHRAWQIVSECAERAGLPKLVNTETGRVHNVSPHRLRDSFAIHAIKKNDSGGGIRMLQTHLGHANINTTMGYRKVAGQDLKNWYTGLWDKSDDNEAPKT